MTPEMMSPADPCLADVLALIHRAFLPMEGRIDPPSSIRHFDLAIIADHAARHELAVLGGPPVAAMIIQPQDDTLYLGKIAVERTARRKGHARKLIEFGAETARSMNLPSLTLKSRIELVENHATFRALGFVETCRTSHAGFEKPTSITFTMLV